nr:MAG TPA: hypothetical protein [Caudoviricetes sp.]
MPIRKPKSSAMCGHLQSDQNTKLYNYKYFIKILLLFPFLVQLISRYPY